MTAQDNINEGREGKLNAQFTIILIIFKCDGSKNFIE